MGLLEWKISNPERPRPKTGPKSPDLARRACHNSTHRKRNQHHDITLEKEKTTEGDLEDHNVNQPKNVNLSK